MNSFRTWVKSLGGAKYAAKKVGVTHQTVLLWLRGQRTPRSEHTAAIMSASKGAVSFLDILSLRTNRTGRK